MGRPMTRRVSRTTVELWLLAWTVFLLSALSERDGRRVRTHTLLDDIEIEL